MTDFPTDASTDPTVDRPARPSAKAAPDGAPVTGQMSPRRRQQMIASAVLLSLLVLLALWVLHDFIAVVAWAGVIAITLWPVFRKIEGHRWFEGRTRIIAALLTAAIALLVVLPVGIGIAQALHEAHDSIEWIRDAQDNGFPVPSMIGHLPFSGQITTWWQANLAQPLRESPAMKTLHSQAVVEFGRHFTMRAVHGAAVFGFMLVTLFVIFQAGPTLSGSLLKGVHRAFGERSASLIERMAAAVRGTVSGLVVVGIGEGLLMAIAYLIVGLPHVALLGLITAIAAMLPFCAPVTFCLAGAWLAVQGSVGWAIGLVAFGFVVVFIAEHFVRPVLIGNSTRLPFLLVLFGILGGAETFGLLGLFIGPSLMTVLKVLWDDWVR